MRVTSIKYDGEVVVLKYVNAIGDSCSLEAPCSRKTFQDLLSRPSLSVENSLPVWKVTVNPKKGTIKETVAREGILTLDALKELLEEAEEFVKARRLQLDLFESTDRMNQSGARITKIETVHGGVPA